MFRKNKKANKHIKRVKGGYILIKPETEDFLSSKWWTLDEVRAFRNQLYKIL
jgi:hypothetical protein